jgi:hypothetical protein
MKKTHDRRDKKWSINIQIIWYVKKYYIIEEKIYKKQNIWERNR